MATVNPTGDPIQPGQNLDNPTQVNTSAGNTVAQGNPNAALQTQGLNPINTSTPSPTNTNTTQNTAPGATSPLQSIQQGVQQAQQTAQSIQQQIAQKYQTGFQNAQASGQTPPPSQGLANESITGFTSTTPDIQAQEQQNQLVQSITNTLQNNAGYQQLLQDQQAYLSAANQSQSLSQEYTNLVNQAGIPALNTQLVNMQAVMNGTEQDIRNEITKAGGFATESQVLALTSARNKLLINNYNALLNTKTDLENQINTTMGFAEKDIANAQTVASEKLNFDKQLIDYQNTMRQNAVAAYQKIIDTPDYGYEALYKSTAGDPHAISLIETTLGLQPGMLAQLGSMPAPGKFTTTTDAAGNPVIFNSTTGQFVMPPINQNNPVSNPQGNYGSATSTVVQLTGMDPNMPLAKADAQQLAMALIQNEGSSPAGVQNNPGNIKFAGLPGQINSGVKASDGGTYASYATPQAGQQAIMGIIQNAQSGNSVYGANPTVGSFIDKYTNTAPTASSVRTLDFRQYGLLANTNLNPNNQTDQLAMKYIDAYVKTGSVPTSSQLGRSVKPGEIAIIQQRANDLYFQATGKSLQGLNPSVIKGYQDILTNNNKLQNNLQIQEQTVRSNVDLSLANLKAHDINSFQFAPLNNLIDLIQGMFNDPNIGQMLAQNTTVQNELGSLLAVKNASGTTVFDKMTSAGLISKTDTPANITQKVNTIMQEAVNFASSLNRANADIYKQIDPLMQDPNNPLRDQMQVNQLLSAKNINYNDLQAKMYAEVGQHPGEQPAIDAQTGDPVFATPAEISSGKYIQL